ncbi:uncharacterized protein SPPG_03877 [Spizellomyces punctatus DAOM BR117]|uniref:LAA1-like C-terminal TPR repeats domain-containing protein n=1 Tax=Spizellomyces punctatus (strain DAOM BR117) TaxID=645134 RepID=A0A0L0HIW1_SPIPD|nr:uncharacterized protein SPPG_03877 [Spizellomyces punctatus DAOM BR117]KND00764.1 hypothetical protein SPPG_03877 [Spizellomyces punctatus DAOM BR117]|eukprot:XP_016608803.1 hypothetical protein SPPG_03877 [Spizellomyces punctatus DAOM BR117]
MAAAFVADFAGAPGSAGLVEASASKPVIPDSFHFDEEKFNAADTTEKKELFLFQWLSILARDLNKSSLDTIKAGQADLEKTLLKFLASTNPKPSRPIRRLISRCLVVIYMNGDSRTLFDTLSAVQGMMVNKKLEDPSLRIAAVYCVGILSETHGGKLMSLFPETVTSLLKLYKNAKESDVALRYETIVALTRSLKGAGKGATDVMVKDIVKVAKACVADKLPLMRIVSVELLQAVYEHTLQAPPAKLDEYESLLATTMKALESANYGVRRGIASFVATLLNLSQQPMQKKATAKKGQKGAVAEPEAGNASSATEQNILTVEEMLGLFCTLCTKATSREMRVGIIEAYAVTLKRLGVKFVEGNYATIVKNVVDMATHPKLTTTPVDTIFMRESAGFLLRDAVGKMLSEVAQVNAMKELGNGWLRKWPPVLGTDVAPSEHALVCILNELAALLIDLGPAAAGEEGAVVEPLFKLVAHPSRSVNLALAWCLRALSLALPSHLSQLISKMMALIQKDLVHLHGDKPEFLNRFIGYGNALAALISAAPSHTLYVSFEIMARIFGLSVQLLKSASVSKDYRAMAAQTRVAWTLIGALMCLGPDFVRVHTSQLLLIWKNVFPKPGAKDNTTRTEAEWEYLLTSKEAALAALYSFMIYNPKEVTSTDVAKRIALFLNNTLSFMLALPIVYTSTGPLPPGAPNPELIFVRMESFLRRRLFVCFKVLNPPATYEMSYSLLLRAALDVFAPDPEKMQERFGPPPTSPDKANQAAAQQSLLTSLLEGSVVHVASTLGAEDRGIARVLNRDTDVQALENLIEQQVPGSLENDPHCLYLQTKIQDTPSNNMHTYELVNSRPSPPPIHIATVDAAIELFALLLPLQNPAVQESLMEQLISLTKYPGTKIPPGRKRAMQLNIMAAVIGVLKHVMVKKGALASGKVSVAIRDLVEEFLTGPDPVFRTLSCEVLGRLARIVGTATFVNPLIQNLVDNVVKNRDPDVRAGSSLALGYILSYVGGMAASSQLKTVVGILHSLATDPHPLVHTWALHSLWLVIESAGLMYGPFVNSTLSVAVKLLMSESHEITAAAANEQGKNSNNEVYPSIGRILYALVGVIGPELQMSTKVRELCFSLYEELKNEEDPFVVVEAIRCIQHFILFAPKHVDIFTLIPFLQLQLTGNYNTQGYLTRKAAVTCLYQLTQRSPDLVLEAAVNNQLEEQLFALLDMETDGTVRDEIRDTLTNLLKHVAPERPSRWLDLCKSILSKTGGPVGAAPTVDIATIANPASVIGATHEEDDDDIFGVDHSDAEQAGRTEGGGPASAVGTAPGAPLSISAKLVLLLLMPRWRTQGFALACLRQLLFVMRDTKVKEHFDLGLARTAVERQGRKLDLLVFRLADLIRMAFSAATANVNDLRLEGLKLLREILEIFAAALDPDYEDHALLEQYQAQIGAALTPAFANDSAPDVLSLACHVSAVYIGSGINRDLGTLSRVLRLLTAVMERFKDNANTSAGQTTPHADVLLRISIVTAWANLHIASFTHRYLEEVTKPNLPTLADLWMSTLQDYAKVKLDPDVLSNAAGDPSARSSMDSYLEATRHVVLPFYRKSWLFIMQALTSLVDTQPDLFVKQLHGTVPEEDVRLPKTFYVLFGLCVEALSTTGLGAGGTVKLGGIPGLTAGGNISNTAAQKSEREETIMSKVCLESLKRLLTPVVVGHEFLDPPMFLEVMNLFDKLVQTEDVPVQIHVVQIARQIVLEFGDYLVTNDAGLSSHEGSLSSSLDTAGSPLTENLSIASVKGLNAKVYKVVKLLFDVFAYHVPTLSNNPTSTVTANRNLTPDTVALLSCALDTLTVLTTSVGVREQFSAELVPIAFFLYLAILSNDKFQEDLAPRVLLYVKTCVDALDNAQPGNEDARRIIAQTLQSAVSTLLDIFDYEIWTTTADSSSQESDEVNSVMIKNGLLASVVIITSSPMLSHHPGNQERLVKCLGRSLRHFSEQLPLISLQCIRTLLVATAKSTLMPAWLGVMYVRLLLPLVTAWLLDCAEELAGSSAPSTKVPIIEEGLKMLLLFYGMAELQKKKLALLSIVVPVFIHFISDFPDGQVPSFTSSSARQLHIFACQTLLQVAAQHPQQFKVAIAGLKESQRDILQRGLQSVVTLQQQNVGRERDSVSGLDSGVTEGDRNATPKIALKSFANFG